MLSARRSEVLENVLNKVFEAAEASRKCSGERLHHDLLVLYDPAHTGSLAGIWGPPTRALIP
jgi:hypothetical protein